MIFKGRDVIANVEIPVFSLNDTHLVQSCVKKSGRTSTGGKLPPIFIHFTHIISYFWYFIYDSKQSTWRKGLVNNTYGHERLPEQHFIVLKPSKNSAYELVEESKFLLYVEKDEWPCSCTRWEIMYIKQIFWMKRSL